MREQVFISHSSKDRFSAITIAKMIEEKGRDCDLRTFLDEKDIEFGSSIPETIRNAIKGCEELVVLLSQASKDRPWVLIEIGAAWVLGKRIVAVIDKISPDQMPDVIAPYKAVDINEVEDYVDQLVARAREESGT